MDARKALFRAKLREQKQDKRIDSPLVRYNEDDQPVCRVCNVTLKSESLWAAHQASRRHHEAIQNLKAAASGKTSGSATKLDSTKELKKRDSSALPAESELQKNDGTTDFHVSRAGESTASTVSKPVKRTLPEGFFDEAPGGSKPSNLSSQLQNSAGPEVKKVEGNLPENFFDAKEGNRIKLDDRITHSSKPDDGSDSNPIKGALPEGFFDNKDADLRARGIEPVKVDINDAYKEFEKEIQEDLQEVDDRLEEEEIDAAEVREEYESLEHKQYRERVEMVKKRLVEVRAARLMKGQQRPAFMGQDSSDESSSDGDEEENFAVDWRAKHL